MRSVLSNVDDHRRLRTEIRTQVTERLLRVVQSCTKVLCTAARSKEVASGPTTTSTTDSTHERVEGGVPLEMRWVVEKVQTIMQHTARNAKGDTESSPGPEGVADYFRKYHDKKRKQEQQSLNVDFETDSDDSDGPNNNPPSSVQYENVETKEEQEQGTLLAEILRRCIHFLSWPRLPVQLILLNTVDVAMRALYAQDTRREQVRPEFA